MTQNKEDQLVTVWDGLTFQQMPYKEALAAEKKKTLQVHHPDKGWLEPLKYAAEFLPQETNEVKTATRARKKAVKK